MIEKLNLQSGTGRNGEWRKQDFILETADRFPKKICVTAWSEMVNELDTCKIGDQLKVDIDLASREYNGRWYTDVKAWRISAESQAGGSGSAAGAAPAPPVPEEPIENLNEEDDLPF